MTSRNISRLIAIFTLVASAAIWTAKAGDRITVHIYNSSPTPDSVLAAAEMRTGRMFRRAGIDIEWVKCPPLDRTLAGDQVCKEPPDPRLFTFTIRRDRPDMPAPELALGFAMPRVGAGNHAAALYPLIEQMARHNASYLDSGKLLANVMAHELGHLLFGSLEHGGGIMKSNWDRRDLEAMSYSKTEFSSEQATKMRRGLRARVAGWNTVDLLAHLVTPESPR